ncbi:uncharacterized protein LOC117336841 isoform X2 [Pecten maximus]|uniref:uncharacterized protein LOC117336841 isoform X2 n=1 Tax=Pecten maximus TaxID=6579 RepID=UPI0014591104|nr:uncharacterized protein LOC117336841 isoform X2 [Pecten maximus]
MAGDNSVLALDFLKCQHSEEKKMIIPLRNATTFLEVFDRFHGDTAGKSSSFQVKTKTDSGQGHDVLSSLTVGEIVHLFNVRHFVFTCTCELETKAQQLSEINVHAKVATKKAVNAFELMMAGGRSFPSKKKSSSGMKAGLSRKDELYNKLIDKFTSEGLDFPKSTASTDGSYFVQIKHGACHVQCSLVYHKPSCNY